MLGRVTSTVGTSNVGSELLVGTGHFTCQHFKCQIRSLQMSGQITSTVGTSTFGLEHCTCQVEGCRVRQPTLKVDSNDRIKLSSLHRSGNRKLLQVENRISNYTFVTQKWERRVNSNEGNYIY
jgi:hypothetical protein